MQIITIPGCRDGVAVTKIVKYNRMGCVESTTYSDGGVSAGWVEGICTPGESFKFVLCAPNGDKVLVVSVPSPTNPLVVDNTYVNIITGDERLGDPTTLESCRTDERDIQTNQYCDNSENVFGTIIFDISNPGVPLLQGIYYFKTDGSIHTPVNPIEGSCVITYDTPTLNLIAEEQTLTGTAHSLTLKVLAGTATVTIGSSPATILPTGAEIQYTVNTVFTYTVTTSVGGQTLLTTIY